MTTSPPRPDTRRPDASMTLIREMLDRPLDPGYAAAAARREAAGLPPSTGTGSRTMFIALTVVGLILTVSAVTLNRDVPDVTRTKKDLIAQIDDGRGTAQRQSVQVNTLQGQISTAEQRHGDDVSSQLSALETENGALPVKGPGLAITMDDAPDVDGTSADDNPRTSTETSGGRVLARDVQIVTNGLWEAGAEAIAINGQRLSSRSAIRFAGDAILVNFRPLNRPYVIRAIGDASGMETDFADGTAGSYLQALHSNFGIAVKQETVTSMTLPGATSLTTTYAKPLYPAGSTDDSTGGTGDLPPKTQEPTP